MASSVFFKFKSQKDTQRIPFDGTGITVFELKREIIVLSQLSDNKDFDLVVFEASTNQEYQDDTEIIPRGSTIIAVRRPAAKGRGNGARYVSGKAPVKALAARPAGRDSSIVTLTVNPALGASQAETGAEISEEAQISQMLAVNRDQWKQQSDQMASARRVNYNGTARGGKSAVPDRPLPPSYVCYRCGQKGHFIQACPTNDDPSYDNRLRIKRTTGIPRSFLRTVDRPAALDGNTADGQTLPPGVMVNAEGEFVVAEPDTKAWERFQAKQRVTMAAQAAEEAHSKELEEKGLACPIDRKLYNKPSKTPCCGTTFCLDCISNSLIENDFQCPECDATPVLLDDLTDDEEKLAQVEAHKAGKATSAAAKDGVSSSSPIESSPGALGEVGAMATEGRTSIKTHATDSVANNKPQPRSPARLSVKGAREGSVESTTSRKRKAESELENPRLSKSSTPVPRDPSPSSRPGNKEPQSPQQAPSEPSPKNESVTLAPPDATSKQTLDPDQSMILEQAPATAVNGTGQPASLHIGHQQKPTAPAPNIPTTMDANRMMPMNGMMPMNPAMMNQMLAMNSAQFNPMMMNMGMGMGRGMGAAFNPMMNMGMMNPMMGMLGGNVNTMDTGMAEPQKATQNASAQAGQQPYYQRGRGASGSYRGGNMARGQGSYSQGGSG